MGEDGHIASIFGDSLKLFEEKNFCASAEHPMTHQKRITFTGRVINNAKQIVFLITGRNKNSVVDTVLNKKSGFDKLPASYINPTHGKLIWMLDEESSSLIKPF
jgi:6-phosphogluconolactonase